MISWYLLIEFSPWGSWWGNSDGQECPLRPPPLHCSYSHISTRVRSSRGVIHKREYLENLEIFANCYSQTWINPLAVDFYSPRISSTVESKKHISRQWEWVGRFAWFPNSAFTASFWRDKTFVWLYIWVQTLKICISSGLNPLHPKHFFFEFLCQICRLGRYCDQTSTVKRIFLLNNFLTHFM